MLINLDDDVLIENMSFEEAIYFNDRLKQLVAQKFLVMQEHAYVSDGIMQSIGVLPTGRANFSYNDTTIYDPFVDETGRDPVDPVEYYGLENIVDFAKQVNAYNSGK